MTESKNDDAGSWGGMRTQARRVTLVLSVLGAIAVFAAIIWFLFQPKGTVLEQIQDPDHARGVITFIIAVGTIAIALILVVVGIQRGRGTEADEKALQARFDRGKEILAVLVGILGTIVGFYFGASGDEAEAAPEIEIVGPLVVGDPVPGATVTLAAELSGGEAPYVYTLTFGDEALTAVRGRESTDGRLAEEVSLAGLEAGTEVEINLKVEDSEDAEAKVETSFVVGAAPQPPPPADPPDETGADEDVSN